MLTCQDVNGFLLEYVEGTLPPEVRAAFERHLAECPRCVRYLRGYRRTIELAGALAPNATETGRDSRGREGSNRLGDGGSADSRQDSPKSGDVPAELVRAILRATEGHSKG
ncbi:MAG: zf-HC2 domain-containing protein [Planctomycetota bacterium]|nr:zf-HC2 domain-containing protein [Planctomycetota bacterium]